MIYRPNPVKGTVLFDESVLMNEDQNVEYSELYKEASQSFATEEPHTVGLS